MTDSTTAKTSSVPPKKEKRLLQPLMINPDLTPETRLNRQRALAKEAAKRWGCTITIWQVGPHLTWTPNGERPDAPKRKSLTFTDCRANVEGNPTITKLEDIEP